VLPGGPGDAEMAQDLRQVLAGVEYPLSLTDFAHHLPGRVALPLHCVRSSSVVELDSHSRWTAIRRPRLAVPERPFGRGSVGMAAHRGAPPYRFLFVRGVKSFGEGSGFAAGVFRGVITHHAR
jgi:hypothetical protein